MDNLSYKESLTLVWLIFWRGAVFTAIASVVVYLALLTAGLAEEMIHLTSNCLAVITYVVVVGPLNVIPAMFKKRFAGFRLRVDRDVAKTK